MAAPAQSPADASPAAIFAAFLRLGLTAFGGPIAHLEYFRREFVERRVWLSATSYGDRVALCQFLPGPASSQVGIGLGLMRGGLPGTVAGALGLRAAPAGSRGLRCARRRRTQPNSAASDSPGLAEARAIGEFLRIAPQRRAQSVGSKFSSTPLPAGSVKNNCRWPVCATTAQR